MKLEKILDNVNSLEKNAFLKIIDNIISNNPKNSKQIDKILSESINNLKGVDNNNIVKIFGLITEEFTEFLKNEFVNTTSQLDIIIDIVIRDRVPIRARHIYCIKIVLDIVISNSVIMTGREETYPYAVDIVGNIIPLDDAIVTVGYHNAVVQAAQYIVVEDNTVI